MNSIMMLVLNLLVFIFLFVLSFYPMGLFLIEKFDSKFSSHEKIILSFLSSIIIFVITAFLLGITNTRFLMLPLIVIANLYSIVSLKKKLLTPWKDFFRDRKLVLIVVIAIIVQGVINFPSGFLYKNGLLFWSSQGNDGLWHVALMEEIKKSLPIINPIYAGGKLFNYHYLSDVLMGEFGRIYPFLTSLDLYFRFFPVVFSFFISVSVFSFVSRWRKSAAAGYWAIFFTSLSGGFGYIVTYIKNRQIFGGETIFWAAQGNTILGNPPHAVAYALVPACFLLTLIYFRERKLKYLILALIAGGITAGFKISSGFILAVGIIIASLVDFIARKNREAIAFAFFLGLSNLVVVELLSRGAASFLIWQPWWFVRTIIVDPARVGWMDLELRREFYLSLHTLRGTLRVIEYELIAFLLFVVGNLGTRFIGLFIIFENGFKKIGHFFTDIINIMLLGSMLSGLIITLLFVQKGIAYNLIQFMQYFILIFGFFTAAFVAEFLEKIKNKIIRYGVIILLLVISVPTVIGNILEFYGPGRTALAEVSNNELAALSFLKQNTKSDSIILTYPFDSGSHWAYKAQPWPISVWYDTAYVSAISSRRTFLSNEGQVDILGINYAERHTEVQKYFNGDNTTYNKEFITSNKINYVYIYKPLVKVLPEAKTLDGTKIYENNEVVIYKTL